MLSGPQYPQRQRRVETKSVPHISVLFARFLPELCTIFVWRFSFQWSFLRKSLGILWAVTSWNSGFDLMAVFFCLMQFKPIYNYQIFLKVHLEPLTVTCVLPLKSTLCSRTCWRWRPLRLCLFIIMYQSVCVLIHSVFIRGLCGIHTDTGDTKVKK